MIVFHVLTLSALCLVAAQDIQSGNVPEERPSLRPRFSPLTPSELLERVTAARTAQSTPIPDQVTEQNEPIINPYQIIRNQGSREDIPSAVKLVGTQQTAQNGQEENVGGGRSYRKQYGRRREHAETPPNNAANLKELLKQSGTLSLSEILQQKNITLSELLQSKKLAASILSEQQRQNNITNLSNGAAVPQNASVEIEKPVNEKMYSSTSRPNRDPALFKANQRSSYLHKKRLSTPLPDYDTTAGIKEEDKKGDSREDILELLQPGSPVSLATILSSRNMTLAELMEHRERGSKQQQLEQLFQEIFNNPIESGLQTKPSQNNLRSVTSPKLNKGSRDPRLLGLPRRDHYPSIGEEIIDDSNDLFTKQDDLSAKEIRNDDIYDYVNEEQKEDAMPVAVKSAILASGGLLAVTMFIFVAIFLCCKLQQRKRRGSRLPFLKVSKVTKSERSVIIKPTENTRNNNFMEF